MNASEILTTAAATLDQRGKDYDQPEGERSMGRIVETFNALTGHQMTEAQGWQFMACLKLVRMGSAADPTDSPVDCAAYAALAGEALGKSEEKEGRPTETDADGWIPWAGGECPVDEDADVQYRLRNGWEYSGVAGKLIWDQSGKGYDITAYRVVSEKAPAQKPERWKPDEGKRYHYLDADGDIYSTIFYDDYPRDSVRFDLGNCFRTREEAEAKRAEILRG